VLATTPVILKDLLSLALDAQETFERDQPECTGFYDTVSDWIAAAIGVGAVRRKPPRRPADISANATDP
jgi:hypothetical protein